MKTECGKVIGLFPVLVMFSVSVITLRAMTLKVMTLKVMTLKVMTLRVSV